MMRKTKLTYEMVDRAVALKRDGLCDADIIDALGVHKSTFYRWLKDGEQAKSGVKRALCDQLKKAESEYKRQLLTTIRAAALERTQHWTAAAWLLERKYPQEFGKAERRLEGEERAPVQLTLGIDLGVAESDGEGGRVARDDGAGGVGVPGEGAAS